LKTTFPGFSATILELHCPPKAHVADWDLKALKDDIFTRFGVDIYAEGLKPEQMNRQELGDAIFEKLKERYDSKEKLIGVEAMRYHERMIMLSVIDAQWKDHLLGMDHLKEGIGLRGYGQHDPLVEYKRESFDMFEEMMQRFQEETARYLYLMQIMERPRDTGARPDVDGGSPNELSGPALDAGVPSVITGGRGGNGRPPRQVATSVDEIEEAFQRKKKKELEQAAWPAPATCRSSRSCARGKSRAQRSLPLRKRQENTRSVAGQISERNYRRDAEVAEEVFRWSS